MTSVGVWIGIVAVLIVFSAVLLTRASFLRRRSGIRPGTAAVATDLAERLVPSSKFIEIKGVQVHYLQAGSGPDVVLLHGIGASVFIWRFVFPLLELHFRVTALDLPGFGKSAKGAERDYGLDAQTELVAVTLRAIGITRAAVIGSSMGGTIALWLAKGFATQVDRLVAISPATDPHLVPRAAQHMALATPMFRRALNRQTMRLILSRILARRELITDEVVDAYLEPFQDSGESLRAFWSAMRLIGDKRLPHGLADLQTPVLVLYGGEDQMVPRRSMLNLLRFLPRGELREHETAGHHLMEDEPEWLAKQIIEYLR